MIYSWIQLLLSLLVILASAHLLTNALECLGEKLHISEGVTGSLFAAVSTALPETAVPVIALLTGGSHSHIVNEEISVGAILGAPLMLSTLSLCLMTCAVVKSRGLKGIVRPEKRGFTRDLDFFLIAFFLSAIVMYIPHHLFFVRFIIATLLVSLYVLYILLTFKASKTLVANGHGVTPTEPLLVTKIGLRENIKSIVIQLLLAFALLCLGVKVFVGGIALISEALQVSALLLSLLIIPVATELPEKVNSVLWIRRGKDTLAVGNITGAMVFQGTLLPALGIWLTPWQPTKEALLGIVLALAATAWLRINITLGNLRVGVLLLNGILYGLFVWLTLRT